jgi:hypothetical protein
MPIFVKLSINTKALAIKLSIKLIILVKKRIWVRGEFWLDESFEKDKK